MRDEVATIKRRIPARDLAIQWDCATEIVDLENFLPWTPKEGKLERLTGDSRRSLVPRAAAPLSSIDLGWHTGGDIPIEERSGLELTEFAGRQIAPRGVTAFNPAFDITPAELVSAIITERGVARPPYGRSLAALKRGGAKAQRR